MAFQALRGSGWAPSTFGTSGCFLSMPLKLDKQCIGLFLFHFLYLISGNVITHVSWEGSAYFVKFGAVTELVLENIFLS